MTFQETQGGVIVATDGGQAHETDHRPKDTPPRESLDWFLALDRADQVEAWKHIATAIKWRGWFRQNPSSCEREILELADLCARLGCEFEEYC